MSGGYVNIPNLKERIIYALGYTTDGLGYLKNKEEYSEHIIVDRIEKLIRKEQGLHIDTQFGRGYKYVWQCDVCKKRIKRWDGNEPISGILKDPMFERKDLKYNISPPIFYIDRSEW